MCKSFRRPKLKEAERHLPGCPAVAEAAFGFVRPEQNQVNTGGQAKTHLASISLGDLWNVTGLDRCFSVGFDGRTLAASIFGRYPCGRKAKFHEGSEL